MDRRVRTAWLVRQRFRVAANLAMGLGLLLALSLIAAARPSTPSGWLEPGFLDRCLRRVAGRCRGSPPGGPGGLAPDPLAQP